MTTNTCRCGYAATAPQSGEAIRWREPGPDHADVATDTMGAGSSPSGAENGRACPSCELHSEPGRHSSGQTFETATTGPLDSAKRFSRFDVATLCEIARCGSALRLRRIWPVQLHIAASNLERDDGLARRLLAASTEPETRAQHVCTNCALLHALAVRQAIHQCLINALYQWHNDPFVLKLLIAAIDDHNSALWHETIDSLLAIPTKASEAMKLGEATLVVDALACTN